MTMIGDSSNATVTTIYQDAYTFPANSNLRMSMIVVRISEQSTMDSCAVLGGKICVAEIKVDFLGISTLARMSDTVYIALSGKSEAEIIKKAIEQFEQAQERVAKEAYVRSRQRINGTVDCGASIYPEAKVLTIDLNIVSEATIMMLKTCLPDHNLESTYRLVIDFDYDKTNVVCFDGADGYVNTAASDYYYYENFMHWLLTKICEYDNIISPEIERHIETSVKIESAEMIIKFLTKNAMRIHTCIPNQSDEHAIEIRHCGKGLKFIKFGRIGYSVCV